MTSTSQHSMIQLQFYSSSFSNYEKSFKRFLWDQLKIVACNIDSSKFRLQSDVESLILIDCIEIIQLFMLEVPFNIFISKFSNKSADTFCEEQERAHWCWRILQRYFMTLPFTGYFWLKAVPRTQRQSKSFSWNFEILGQCVKYCTLLQNGMGPNPFYSVMKYVERSLIFRSEEENSGRNFIEN